MKMGFIKFPETTPRAEKPMTDQEQRTKKAKNKPEIALVTDIRGEWRAGVTPQTVW